MPYCQLSWNALAGYIISHLLSLKGFDIKLGVSETVFTLTFAYALVSTLW